MIFFSHHFASYYDPIWSNYDYMLIKFVDIFFIKCCIILQSHFEQSSIISFTTTWSNLELFFIEFFSAFYLYFCHISAFYLILSGPNLDFWSSFLHFIWFFQDLDFFSAFYLILSGFRFLVIFSAFYCIWFFPTWIYLFFCHIFCICFDSFRPEFIFFIFFSAFYFISGPNARMLDSS